MGTSIEKFKLEERIRLLCLKHRGDVNLIAQEGGVPVEYVIKIVNKIRKRQKADVSYFIGTSMAEYILLGSEQRRAYLLDELRRETGRQPEELSMCCNQPVKKYEWDGEDHGVCTKCGENCGIKIVDHRNPGLIMKIIDQLRKEDAATVQFLETMGFVGSQDSNAPKITQYNLSINGGKQSVLSEEDKKTLVEAQSLDPRTRERLRKEIERKVIEADFEDGKK